MAHMPTTTPRKRRTYETADIVSHLRRQFRALSRRVSDGDPIDLAMMVGLRDELDAAIDAAVKGQRATHGSSWAELGQALGVTRQAVQKRYGG